MSNLNLIALLLLTVLAIFIVLMFRKNSVPAKKPATAKAPTPTVEKEEYAQELTSLPNFWWKGKLNKSIDIPELPQFYPDPRLELMVQHPQCLFAYWNLPPGFWEDLPACCGLSEDEEHRVLRFYEANNQETLKHLFDIDLKNDINHCFVNVPKDNCTYLAELGLLKQGGIFLPVLRSKPVTTPRASVSTVIDHDWLPCGIYEFMGPIQYGISSLSFSVKKERIE